MDDHQRPCRRCGRTVHTELFLAQTRPLVGLTHRATHCLLLGWAGTSVSGKKCLRWQRLALLQRGFCFCPQGPFWPHPRLPGSCPSGPPTSQATLSSSPLHLFPLSFQPLVCGLTSRPADCSSHHCGFSNGSSLRKPDSGKKDALVLRLPNLLLIFKLIWKLKT